MVMKVQWFRSATVAIITKSETKVLCDPWITDGAFIGSWFHFPKLEGFEFEEIVGTKWDAIYISHLHADHFDRKLVAAIARNQPDCKVLLPKFAHRWLYRAVKNCGFRENQIYEIESGKPFVLRDLTIKVFTADYCAPEVCGISVPCNTLSTRESAIDSLAVFEADSQKILNANDALAVNSAAKLWPIIGKVDLLLGHYGGAGPYPQCFSQVSEEEKLIESKKLATTFLSRLAEAANKLHARFVMPYAGQYVLSGSLMDLNKFRSVVSLTEALNFLALNSSATPIAVEPFSRFDLDSESLGKEWVEPTAESVNSYLNEISSYIFPYQRKKEVWENGQQLLESALVRVEVEYLKRLALGRAEEMYSVTLKTENFGKTINFNGANVSFTDANNPIYESNTKLDIDERLLKRLILRAEGYSGFTQYHFNQAEIGSHISWSRSGSHNRVTGLLNFMQTKV
jgi:UDP-MurNAc hydroxylase